MFISKSRRRRRRWPIVLAVVIALAGVGGALAYDELVKAPGDVTNPDVEFAAPDPEPGAGDEPRRGKRDTRVLWPTYGLNPARTRWLQRDLDPPFKRVWHFGGSKLIEFPPVLAKQTLFFTKNDGEAYAISARTGNVRWRRDLGYKSASSPAWSKNRLFITILERRPGSAGKIYALGARHGRILWAKDLPSRSESSPVAIDGRIFFGTENGTVYALRAKDGKEVWRYRAAGSVKAALAYADGRLYFGDYAGQVTALDASTGRRVWRTGTEGRSFGRSGNFYSTPTVAFGRVYLGNTDTRVYSLSANTGELAWSRSTGGFVYGAPAVANVEGAGPAVYIGSYDGNFYALDAKDGSTLWTHRAGGRISGSPTVVGDIVYFANLGAKSTTGLDAASGRKRWSFGRGSFTPVVSDGDRLYVTGYSSLYAFEPKKERSRRGRSRSRSGSS
ncbi:MAG TPA: PQQ-binding-like beta-propeller repeat protein [Thermoleophilaceae bacterium]|nr:PQQ-binding-like beta-propeller repeat protein [Thermoleophilaceae bacterium]